MVFKNEFSQLSKIESCGQGRMVNLVMETESKIIPG